VCFECSEFPCSKVEENAEMIEKANEYREFCKTSGFVDRLRSKPSCFTLGGQAGATWRASNNCGRIYQPTIVE